MPGPSPVDPEKLDDGTSPHWVGYTIRWHPQSFLKPITHFQFYSPTQAVPQKNITDLWMRFKSPQEKFTTEMLGSVADHWHRMLENYVPDSVWNSTEMAKRALRAAGEEREVEGYSTSYTYPTFSMSLEIKKRLPTEGVRWLFLRARSTEIQGGRFDAEVTVWDSKLNLVALSHQICLAIKSVQIADRITTLGHGNKL